VCGEPTKNQMKVCTGMVGSVTHKQVLVAASLTCVLFSACRNVVL
jgi:hypothetical protein